MKRLYLLIAFFFLTTQCFCQSVQWINVFTYGDDNTINDIDRDAEGNIYCIGKYSTESYGGGPTTTTTRFSFIQKTAASGIILRDDVDTARVPFRQSISIRGNFYYTSGLRLLNKYSLEHQLIWHNGEPLYEEICRTKNNQLYIAGRDTSSKYYISSLDTMGTQLWKNYINYNPKKLIVHDNYLYILEDKNGAGGENISQYDTLGNLLWSKLCGMGYVWNIATDDAANCYMIGEAPSENLITKMDALGNIVWSISRPVSDSISYYNAVISTDTAFVCGNQMANGSNKSSISLYSAHTGQYYTTYLFDLLPGVTDEAHFILKDNNDFYLAGIGGNYMSQLFLAKVSLKNTTAAIIKEEKENYLSVFPNPNGGIFTVKFESSNSASLNLTVKNALGQTVYNKTYTNFAGTLNDTIDLSKQPKGVYFIELLADKKRQVKRIVLD